MINVFICTYNPNYSFLLETVRSLLAQDLDKAEWTLTIIDNNSKSPVAEIDFVKEMKIEVAVERQQGLTAARRCATDIAAGELLVFVDDDNILNTNYLSEVKRLMTDKQIGILSGNISPRYEQQPEGWFKKFEPMLAIREFDTDADLLFNTEISYNSLFPIGAGMVIRQQLIHDYYANHLSSENYIEGRRGDELTASEDIDLDLYAMHKGYKIGVSPRLRMLHIIPPRRIERDYIVKLAMGSIKSGLIVNKKWEPVFKQNIFSFLEPGYFKLLAAMSVCKILSFKPSFYIRYYIFKESLRYKRMTS